MEKYIIVEDKKEICLLSQTKNIKKKMLTA